MRGATLHQKVVVTGARPFPSSPSLPSSEALPFFAFPSIPFPLPFPRPLKVGTPNCGSGAWGSAEAEPGHQTHSDAL